MLQYHPANSTELSTISRYDLHQSLVPVPQRVRRQPGRYDLARLRTCVCDGCAQPEEWTHLQDEVRELLDRRLVRAQRSVTHTIMLRVDGVGVRGKGLESYMLAIRPDGIGITGASARAVFWGLQTLWQIRAVYVAHACHFLRSKTGHSSAGAAFLMT